MPSITLLEQTLRGPDARRHALALIHLLSRRRERLIQYGKQSLSQTQWRDNQQLILACEAAHDCIAILYRRYHNQRLVEEKNHDHS
ncbi:EscE/YscE/SsaE family type III secretion system needle protein co-chaperone [Enterobacter cancerogenus]